MSGESRYAINLVQEAMEEAQASTRYTTEGMSRALLAVVIQHYQSFRTRQEIAAEMQFLLACPGEENAVITRGC